MGNIQRFYFDDTLRNQLKKDILNLEKRKKKLGLNREEKKKYEIQLKKLSLLRKLNEKKITRKEFNEFENMLFYKKKRYTRKPTRTIRRKK